MCVFKKCLIHYIMYYICVKMAAEAEDKPTLATLYPVRAA